MPEDKWEGTAPNGMIPDGFYTIGNSQNSKPEFYKAIIDSVRKVTHITEADSNGFIIGEP